MNWLNYFQSNREHRREIPWEQGVRLDPRVARSVVRSLQRFQLGESGDGVHLRRHAASMGDAEYNQCIDLFIREEQEHSRMMAWVLHGVGAPLLKSHWSDVCFILLRRYLGLRAELLVLMVAEMIAKRYFRALHDATGNPVLRAVCGQILHDEEGHVVFHIDHLQRMFASKPFWQQALVRIAWRVLFRAACLVVLWDHRAVLRLAKVSPVAFWWDCGLIFDEAAAAIFYPAGTSLQLAWRRQAGFE